MDPIAALFLGMGIAFGIIGIAAHFALRRVNKQIEQFARPLVDEVPTSSEDDFGCYIETRMDRLEDKTRQLYKHLNVLYREVPTHGEVVTISSLNTLGGIAQALANQDPLAKKSTKERSA